LEHVSVLGRRLAGLAEGKAPTERLFRANGSRWWHQAVATGKADQRWKSGHSVLKS
jgi:hypothetical protein